MKITGPASTIKNARVLRRTMTMPETMLWRRLRGSPEGIRFRRHHPAGPYVLDFFCATVQLAIEIDGMAHTMGDAVRRDERRDAFLTAQGITILRISATDVLRDADRTAVSIVAAARERLPLHHASHGPPPPEVGEDFRSVSWNT